MLSAIIFASILLMQLPACGAFEAVPALETQAVELPSPSPMPVQSFSPIPTLPDNPEIGKTVTPFVDPTNNPTAIVETCSPLHGFQLIQLDEIISTPYDPPPPGQDSGHHGVDFGFYSYGAFTQMEGLPVQTILAGQVAAVIDDRPPYGNMVIIETPISSLPQSWQNYIANLPPLVDYELDGRLACPDTEAIKPVKDSKSLYILYAHMSDPATLSIGDSVGCGQQLGFVGTTGFSVNAHLHLETRLGPAQVQFLHLAHYVNNATVEEMANYCTWRVGPDFRLIDPMALLELTP